MKFSSKRLWLTCLVSIAAAVLLTGCPPVNMLSWSPDGHSLAFIHPQGELWRYDTATREAKKLTETSGCETCLYTPSGKGILLASGEGQSDLQKISLFDVYSQTIALVAEHVNKLEYGVSPDDQYFYYIQEKKAIVEVRMKAPEKRRALYESKVEMEGLAVSPDGQRILFATPEGVQCLYLRNLQCGTVFQWKEAGIERQDAEFYYLKWADNRHALLLIESEANNDDLCDLYRVSIDDHKPVRVAQGVYPLTPPSVSPDGASALFTKVLDPAAEDLPDNLQLVRIEFSSGKTTVVRRDPFGALNGSYGPDGKTIAYISGGEDEMALMLYEPKRAAWSMVWNAAEQPSLPEAFRFEQEGNPEEAAAAYRQCVTGWPENKECERAWHGLMELYLGPKLFHLDRAYDAMNRLDTKELVEGVRTRFWRPEDRLASDPAADWILRHGTEASQREFGFNTDETRDLRGLWARWGEERLYLCIEYTSDADLYGLTFQDTVLLLDYGTPDSGLRTIQPGAEWDRGAERQVFLRHWYEAGNQSQYDLEIRDGQGETISRFLSSGFSPANYPPVVYMRNFCGESPGGTPCVVVGLSREVLDPPKDRPISMQVCTFKGGIESVKKAERPLEAEREGKAVCSVADAFGEENTATRLEADWKEGKPPIIRGVTAVLPSSPAK